MLPDQDPNLLDESISRHDFLGLLGGLTTATIATQTALAAKPGQMDTPILAFLGANKHSIELQVTAAGSSGTPAGFAIQWIKAFDPVSGNGTWHNQSGSRIETATFAAAADSRYSMSPGQSVNVKIGELLFDSGVTTTHPYALKHSTEYYFRAFALARNHATQSDYSPNFLAGTLLIPTQCIDLPNACTSNLSWWTQNGPGKCSANANPNRWPVNSLQLGDHNYGASDLCRLLQRSGDEFGVNAMVKQLIAAKLNVARGENTNFITAAIASADAIIGSQTLPANGKDGFPTDQTFALVIALTNYNEGDTGPGACC